MYIFIMGSHKDLAIQRIEIILANALENAKYDPELAEKEAMLARRISTKYRVRLPYHLRQLFCRKCKGFIIPGRTARLRIGRSTTKAVRITCLRCGHTYRKVIT